METSPCPPEEDLLRGIASPHWDEKNGRLERGYWTFKPRFDGDGISVSRLAILSREEVINVFRRELDRPPKHALLGAVEINVGVLQEIGLNYREQPRDKPHPVELTVVPDPTDTNPAHALIPHKITRGLSVEITTYLEENGLVTRWEP
jgi:hypothetical protein